MIPVHCRLRNGNVQSHSWPVLSSRLCVCAMCREQWHAVNCPHGHWSCSCVACWKDKATARASDGWHSTLAELTAVRGCCFVTCCAARQVKNKFYCFIFSQSASGTFPLPTVSLHSYWYGPSVWNLIDLSVRSEIAEYYCSRPIFLPVYRNYRVTLHMFVFVSSSVPVCSVFCADWISMSSMRNGGYNKIMCFSGLDEWASTIHACYEITYELIVRLLFLVLACRSSLCASLRLEQLLH